jgi:carboxymethylenebutenolidase
MLKNDVDSLTPSRDFSRRDFVQTAVGSGFAAAVLPVGAQTITTDTGGLTAGPVTIPVGTFSMPAYRAAPAGKTNLPVILVVSEVFGVHEHIADVARRFAKQGYLAIAPELFVRQGDAKAPQEISKLIADIINKVPDEQVMGDLDATVAWAKGNGGDTSRLGVTGFCWGGRIAWLFDAHNAGVKAGVAWYGRLVGDSTPLTPKHPVDLVGQLHGPVLGLYGGADQGIPLDTVEKMKAALAGGNAAAKKSEFVVYPDTPHAFHADYRPSYRKAAAEDGWKRCLAWFKANGVA